MQKKKKELCLVMISHTSGLSFFFPKYAVMYTVASKTEISNNCFKKNRTPYISLKVNLVSFLDLTVKKCNRSQSHSY